MTIALSAAFGLLSVAFYLLARLYSENGKLVSARKRTAALMRRVRRRRDEAEEQLIEWLEAARKRVEEADEKLQEAEARNFEQELEIAAYEDERKARLEARRLAGRVWFS